MWKGLKEITNYKSPSPSTVENQQLADDLKEFYCRFEKTPHTCHEHLSTQPLTPPATPLSSTRKKSEKKKSRKLKSPRPRLCYTSLSVILCWPAGHHLHKDLQQITGTAQSPLMLQTLHHHPHPKEIQNYRTKWLQAYGSKHLRSWNHLKNWCWPTWRTSLEPCWILFSLPTEQTNLWTMQSTWDWIMFYNI